MQMGTVERISSAVSACCILYNFSRDPEDPLDDQIQDIMDDDDPHPRGPRPNEEASMQRDAICSRL